MTRLFDVVANKPRRCKSTVTVAPLAQWSRTALSRLPGRVPCVGVADHHTARAIDLLRLPNYGTRQHRAGGGSCVVDLKERFAATRMTVVSCRMLDRVLRQTRCEATACCSCNMLGADRCMVLPTLSVASEDGRVDWWLEDAV